MVTHRYQPVGTAIEVLNARDPEVLTCGPVGTGKSRACLEKIHLIAMLNSDVRILMLRKTLASLTSSGVVSFKTHIIPAFLESGEVKWFGGSPQEPAAFKYKNGSTIVLGGVDKAQKYLSAEYDIIYVQEANELNESDWETLLTRLRNGKLSFQQILADCNPDTPTHWLKQRCDSGKTRYIASRIEDNPRMYDAAKGELTPFGATYIGNIKNSVTGVRYQRYIQGLWSAAEGLVYEEFNPEINIYKALPTPPESWRRYLSIDFGYQNPFVCQWWAEDEDGRLYLYKELYETHGIVEDHAKKILANMGRQREPRPSYVITDHDAEGRATLEKYLGMPTTAAKKTVTDGINAVASRIKVQGDGRPRIYLCRDAIIKRDPLLLDSKKPTSTLDEITGYIWNQSKDVPEKENDHGMDAMRYMVAFKDLQPQMGLRTFSY